MAVLKIEKNDENREIEFELSYLWFASLDDLIRMKKATGRPKDREDLKYLLKLKK
jgi:hypothetical protein